MTKLETLLDEAILFFQPIVEAVEDEDALADFFEQFGYNLHLLNMGMILQDINRATPSIKSTFDNLLTSSIPSADELVSLVQNIFLAVRTFSSTTSLQSVIGSAEGFYLEILDFLTDHYLSTRIPCLASALKALSVITRELIKTTDSGGRDFDYIKSQLIWDRLVDFILDTKAWAQDVYGWDGDPASVDTKIFSYELAIENISNLIEASGLALSRFRQMTPSETAVFLKNSSGVTVYEVAIPIFQDVFDKVEPDGAPNFSKEAGVKIVPFGDLNRPQELGLALAPYAKGNVDGVHAITSNLDLNIRASTSAAGGLVLAIQPVGLHGEGVTSTALSFDFSLHYDHDDSSEITLLGEDNGTRLQSQALYMGISASFALLQLEAGARDSKIVIVKGDGDGFLDKVLPEQPIVIPFELGIGWSNIKGLYFRGSAGLEATLPVHKDLLGVLKIDSIYLALRAKNSNIETVVAATAGVKLGPFTANVERMGLLAKLTFPPNGGNLGPVNLELGFKPPDGAGMAIDGTAIVGGGYLFYNLANEQYAGILQIEVKGGISLKAIGLLTTRLPGLPPGTKGFSLLVIISAEFPPIQLGFGFTLTGVGGLLGVNRTMVQEVLQSGIKNHTLDSILFPQNPVANAPQIISDLQSVFPPVTGQYVFGPMARLSWGTPTILSVELGIVLEFPSPVRLAIMGQLRMALPSLEVEEKFQVVVLRMDVVGGIDFDKGDASIDATLYDSRVGLAPRFVISGDMAMRLNWGASPAFALSVGGFNPRFQPPPKFPSLDRLAIALATGDNPRIRLEAYLAVTTNTVQLGARLDVYAAYDLELTKAEGFANLSFDALVYLSPFSFVVDIEGYISVKVPPWPTISGWLYLSLSGPDPWHAQGGVLVEFFGKRHIPIDVKVGEEGPPPPLPPGDPLGDLRKALKDTRNWSAQLPNDGHMLVTLRRIPISENSPEVLMHPFGELTFRQKVVPLDTPISKYGSTTPLNTGPFTITDVTFNDKTTEETRQTVRDLFAPGQFFELSDDQKLSWPSFQSLPSGCTGIGTAAISHSATTVSAEFQYDTVVIDKKEEQISRRGPGFEYVIAEEVLLAVAGLGSAGQSALSSTGAAKFAGSTVNRVQVKDAEYIVASKEDMKGEDPKLSYIEAEAARSSKGAESEKYQVVGKHEVP